jgi:hypothetical protein
MRSATSKVVFEQDESEESANRNARGRLWQTVQRLVGRGVLSGRKKGGGFFPIQTPLSVFAQQLITIALCLAKTIKISFQQLFLMN